MQGGLDGLGDQGLEVSSQQCFFRSISTPAGIIAILILVGHATAAAPFLRADPTLRIRNF